MRTFSKTSHPTVSMAILMAAGLLLAACGSEEPTDGPTATQAPSPAPTVSEEATPGPDDQHDDQAAEESGDQLDETGTEPIGEFTTELQQSEDWPAFGDTEGIYPVEVRSAIHHSFERIVIEHAGTGTPSHMAQYTAEPREPGIGTIVDTGDAAYLEVIVSGTGSILDVDEDQMLEHGAEITDLNTQATGTVVSFSPWEATSSYIIGLDEQRPYAVAILEDPVRVVIDIQLAAQP